MISMLYNKSCWRLINTGPCLNRTVGKFLNPFDSDEVEVQGKSNMGQQHGYHLENSAAFSPERGQIFSEVSRLSAWCRMQAACRPPRLVYDRVRWRTQHSLLWKVRRVPPKEQERSVGDLQWRKATTSAWMKGKRTLCRTLVWGPNVPRSCTVSFISSNVIVLSIATWEGYRVAQLRATFNITITHTILSWYVLVLSASSRVGVIIPQRPWNTWINLLSHLYQVSYKGLIPNNISSSSSARVCDEIFVRNMYLRRICCGALVLSCTVTIHCCQVILL